MTENNQSQNLYDRCRKLSFVDLAQYLRREWNTCPALDGAVMILIYGNHYRTIRVKDEDNLSFLRGLLIGMLLEHQSTVK
jgi:hypothetical protein